MSAPREQRAEPAGSGKNLVGEGGAKDEGVLKLGSSTGSRAGTRWRCGLILRRSDMP